MLTLLLTSVPAAEGAEVTEIPLPEADVRPHGVGVDADGVVWFTAEGAFGMGRHDPADNTTELIPFTVPRSGERDAAWAVTFDSEGNVWTATSTHLHRLDKDSLEMTAYELPSPTVLGGDVLVTEDGHVWVALVTADALARFDPDTESFTTHALAPNTGPLAFTQGPLGIHVTLTYGNTYGTLDPERGEVIMGAEPSGAEDAFVRAPVGILDDGDVWIAEHGADSLVRVDPESNARERFPTTPSPYYPISGPSGVVKGADGAYWFVEHFADRVARLDPEARTLHEFEVPSAPGTNMQYLAEGPDGRIWFAEWTTNQLGYATMDVDAPGVEVPASVTAAPGEAARIPVTGATGEILVGVDEGFLEASVDGDEAVVNVAEAAVPGTYNVLVSVKDGSTNAGRYVSLVVGEAASEGSQENDTPAVPTVLALAILGLAALVGRGVRARR